MNIPPAFKDRVSVLNDRKVTKNSYVVYWMQQSQRAFENPALEYSILLANNFHLPLVVLFVWIPDYRDANKRHYTFMLEGLKETEKDLMSRGIQMIIKMGSLPETVILFSETAACMVCDRGYMNFQTQWYATLAKKVKCRVLQVEGEVLVPVEKVSNKAEYAARTFRPKLLKLLPEYGILIPGLIKHYRLKVPSINLSFETESLQDPKDLFKTLKISKEVNHVSNFYLGGISQAKKRFSSFLAQSIEKYQENHNQPQTDYVSHMSMFLQFGQISSLYLLEQIKKTEITEESRKVFLEQLLIRRELCINHVFYCSKYDSFKCIPDWAIKTLMKHKTDPRPFIYSEKEIENAETHDPYWNAAMNEMKYTGYMHNHMRMYWGKKILEWSDTPEKAFSTILTLNNRYFLDGRGPNAFANVCWIFGLHDRPWKERPIFGTVRYMSQTGLEKKVPVVKYVNKVYKMIGVQKKFKL